MTEAAGIAHPSAARRGAPALWCYLNGGIFRRAALVASILGSVLTLANQSGALFGPEALRLVPLVLVFLTPFAVVVLSQVLGARQAMAEARWAHGRRAAVESLAATALSHGIPMRAMLLGLLVGSVNTAIVATAAVLEQGNLNTLPLPLLGQVFSLPIVFGALSQAIAYRRTATARAGTHAPAALA